VLAVRKEDVKDPILLREIELSENVQRVDLHWSDHAQAVKELYELRKQQSKGKYPQKKFAQEIGMSPASVSEIITMAEAVESFPDLTKAPSREAAVKTLKNLQSQLLVEEVQKRAEQAAEQPAEQADDVRAEEEKRVILGRAEEVLKRFKPEQFNAIVTDPPFGIELLDKKIGASEVDKRLYGEDTEDAYKKLMSQVAPLFYKVLKKDSHLWMFFAPEQYQFVVDVLSDAGFVVDKIPCIWYKGLQGQTIRPETHLARAYECFIYARKGNLPIQRQGYPNVLNIPILQGGEKMHPTEKPEALMHTIITFSLVPTMTVLDPFCGSGTTLVAAKKLRVGYVGIEKESFYREVALQRLCKVVL